MKLVSLSWSSLIGHMSGVVRDVICKSEFKGYTALSFLKVAWSSRVARTQTCKGRKPEDTWGTSPGAWSAILKVATNSLNLTTSTGSNWKFRKSFLSSRLSRSLSFATETTFNRNLEVMEFRGNLRDTIRRAAPCVLQCWIEGISMLRF